MSCNGSDILQQAGSGRTTALRPIQAVVLVPYECCVGQQLELQFQQIDSMCIHIGRAYTHEQKNCQVYVSSLVCSVVFIESFLDT